jgi:hypothetical protein
VLRGLGPFNPNVRETVEMMYQFEQPFVVDDSKFVSTFGAQATPLDNALQTTLSWYRNQDGTSAA